MKNSEIIMKELLETTERLGLKNVKPEVLSDAGNLIVHLSPYPIVARIAKLFSEDDPDFWKHVGLQELKVVKHLMEHDVPVVSFTTQVPPGPHKIGSTWMTLWEYIAPASLPPLESKEAINMIDKMMAAMNEYIEPLRPLGVWENVIQAAENLAKRSDKDDRIIRLLQEFEAVNNIISNLKLYPAHGDAHPRNLIQSSTGWRWTDFEDVSLMPKFWDLASFIGNSTLLHGLKHPNVDYVLKLKSVAADKEAFQFALRARVVMSITTNLFLALDGNGDLDFALSQLSCFNNFLSLINNEIKKEKYTLNNNIIENFGYTGFYKAQEAEFEAAEKGLIPGRIIEVQREQYKIITNEGESAAKLKGSLFYNEAVVSTYPAVGDFVLVKHNPIGEDIIYHVLDRKSKFSRLDSFNEIEQIVATNFDYVFIMTSLNHDFNLRRVERYLASAWESGAIPVIVLTKADLCSDYEDYVEQIESIAFGVAICPISSVTGEGMEKLHEFVKPGKTIVFLGSSGVGKSSLVNVIAGEDVMKVNGIREDDSRGRHTTTHRQLIMMENGTMIIDTPGMRELGMWNASEGLDTAFTDIEELAENCKFRDCSHGSEPGCAVKKALGDGELSPERWQSYLKLKKEIRFAEMKENSSVRANEKARWKSISKAQRQNKKGGGLYA